MKKSTKPRAKKSGSFPAHKPPFTFTVEVKDSAGAMVYRAEKKGNCVGFDRCFKTIKLSDNEGNEELRVVGTAHVFWIGNSKVTIEDL